MKKCNKIKPGEFTLHAISSKGNLMKIILSTVVALVALIDMNVVAAQETVAQPRGELVSQDVPDDCIEKVVNDSSGFKFTTRKGYYFQVYRDALQRVALVVNNGRSFKPVYDKNFPEKIVSIKSMRDGKEIPIPAGFSGQAPNVAIERLKSSARSLKPCNMLTSQAPSGSAKAPATSASLMAAYDGWEYGEDWAGAGFSSDFINEAYWIDQDRPYFEEAVQFAERQSAQRSCIDRANACSDACDTASDARNISCAIGVLIYSEIPIGAGLFGIACALASNKEKYECKDRCPSISSCF